MAYPIDSTSNSGVKATVSSYTWTHTTGTLINGILIVCVSSRGATSNANIKISGITYNGVALTKAIQRDSNDSPSTATISTEIWYLVNPAAGSNTVQVTFTGTVNHSAGYALTAKDMHQTSLPDATNGSNTQASSSPNTTSLTTVRDYALVVDVIYNKIGTSLTAGTNQTLISTELLPNGGGDTADASYKYPVTPAGSTSMSWTFSGTDDYCQVVASFKPANPIPRRLFAYNQSVHRANSY